MKLSRRDFLKLSGATAGGAVALSTLPTGVAAAKASDKQFDLHKKIGESTTVCCYCGVGCGAIVAAEGEETLVNLEGDPDHPINEGSLCPKGQAMAQIHQVNGEINPQRLTKPLYRAPGAAEWEEKSYEWMIETIAHRIKDTRDQYFITQAQNASGATVTVNRCEAIGQFGGGELDNEECYLATKMARALGIVFLEHCARL